MLSDNRKRMQKVVIISLLVFVVLGIIWFSYSYAIFKKEIEATNVDLRVGELSYNLTCEKLENNRITITPNMSEVLNLKLTSLNEIDSKYELYYKIISPEVLENEVEGGYVLNSEILPSGVIGKDEEKNIQLIFNNTGNQEITVEIFIKAGLANNELVLEDSELSLSKELIQKFYVFDYTGDSQEFTVPVTGTYKVELWGAEGAQLAYNGGKGAYVTGILTFLKDEKFYVYLGEKGERKPLTITYGTRGFNGGGPGNYTCYTYYGGNGNGYNCYGGGATDIRLKNGNWNDVVGLRSRIMVAAGGGSGNRKYLGNAGGGLIGYDTNAGGTKATQISAGSINGGFGLGGYPAYGGAYCNNSEQVGAGSGYYGGGGSSRVGDNTGGASGASGSSFISGHAGCIAIKSESDQTPKVTTYSSIENSYHYSGKIFTDTVMIDGAGYNWTTVKGEKINMPTHDLTSTMVGNTGHGYARITYVGK